MAKKQAAVGFEGFKEFIRKQGVVGFGVAFVLGTAVAEFIKTFIESLVTPIINAVLGGNSTEGSALVEITDGNFLAFGDAFAALVNFLIIAFVVYALVKATGVDSWDADEE